MRFATGRWESKQICNVNICEWRQCSEQIRHPSVTKFLVKYAANFPPLFWSFFLEKWSCLLLWPVHWPTPPGVLRGGRVWPSPWRTASPEQWDSSSSLTGRSRACQSLERDLLTSSAKSIKQKSSLAKMDPFQSIAGELRIRNDEFPFLINVMVTMKICILPIYCWDKVLRLNLQNWNFILKNVL